MIVVDTNLMAYLCLPSDRTALAEQVWSKDPLWAAPLLWRSEFRNVLVGVMRRKQMSPAQASTLATHAETLLSGREYTVEAAHVLRLAAQSTCSAYDCEFVALAEDLGVALVTADVALLTSFPSTAIAMERFVK